MPTGPGDVVAAPPLAPPVQGLVRSTPLLVEDNALPARWEAGVRFAPEVCGLPGVWAVCSTAVLPSGNNRRAVRDYEPFAAVAYDECSAFGLNEQERQARARRALLAKDTLVLEREFWSGTLLATNPRLADATKAEVLGYGLQPVLALAALSQGLADAGVGLGMIHVRPWLATLWLSKNLLRWDGQRWVTLRGDIVVAGSGYPGTGPSGELPAGGVEWAYATELVQVYRGNVDARPANADEVAVMEAMQKDPATGNYNNTLAYRAQRMLAAVHNGCAAPDPAFTHVAVSVNTAAV
jgi:hypothetical protein